MRQIRVTPVVEDDDNDLDAPRGARYWAERTPRWLDAEPKAYGRTPGEAERNLDDAWYEWLHPSR